MKRKIRLLTAVVLTVLLALLWVSVVAAAAGMGWSG
jgi:hypothetical protein